MRGMCVPFPFNNLNGNQMLLLLYKHDKYRGRRQNPCACNFRCVAPAHARTHIHGILFNA